MKEFFKSKKFQHILLGIGLFLAVLVIFEAGMVAGYHKAFFSYRMGEDYYKTFDNGDNGMMPIPGFMNARELPNQNGAVGNIVKISLPTITVADKDGVEKTILIGDDTVIRQFRDTLQPADLAIGNFIIVIGSPNNQSQIDANLIRVLPAPAPLNTTQNPPTSATTNPVKQ